MPLTPEQFMDRRRLQRRISFWRTFAFVAVLLVISAAGWRYSGQAVSPALLTPHIARIEIKGLITGERDTIKLIDDVAASNAAAVIIDIESPGGTTSGSERLYDALRRLSRKKPTAAVVRGMAASGAYIAAIGTDHIVAQTTSLVGSIGVLFEFPNVSGALDKIGVKMETIKSSPLKAAPNGFEPTTPAARAAIDALVVDSYAWFKDLVKLRRGMSDAELAAVDDGRVFTGHQGLNLKLVDQIGEERDAIAWLQANRGVAKSLPMRTWTKGGAFASWRLFSMASSLADALGLPDVAATFAAIGRLQEQRSLDGLQSLWQVR